MKKILLTLVFSFICIYGFSQDNIPKVYDFTGYTGAGLTPTPSVTQLDSDSWSVTGMSEGDSDFGDTNTGGDFARGNTDIDAGVSTGGLYSFFSSAIWFQPGGSDFTPGELILKICNNSGATMDDIEVDYDIKYLNDQERSNSFNFSWSTDNVNYTAVGALDFTTPVASDANGVQTVAKNTTFTANLTNMSCLFLKWSSDDISGSGSRDEIGIDNIDVKENVTPTPVNLITFTAKPMDTKTIALNWSTASEENNDYFSIEHSTDGRDFTELALVEGVGTTFEAQDYDFMHKEAFKGMNYYRLRQVDFDGTFAYSSVQVVELASHADITLRPTLAGHTVDVLFSSSLDKDTEIEVINIMGRTVIRKAISAGTDKLQLDVHSLHQGHYFVRTQINGKIKTTRFIKI